MARQTQAEIETEKKKKAERETVRTGKVLGSQPGSEEERRQQALAMLKNKTQAKRDGKRIAADESAADIAHKQAPPKRARAPRGQGGGALVLKKSKQEANLTISTQAPIPQPKPPTKRPTSQLVCEEVHQNQVLKDQQLRAKQKKEGKRPVVEESDSEKAEDPSPDSDEDHGPPKRKNFNAGRDRKKKPTEAELVEQMRKGIAWPPTRFVDRSILQGLYLEDDVKEMLEFMKIGSFYSVAYQTYPEVSCQFLSTLEATFHTKKIAQQGWGRITFKIAGQSYTMSFTEIGEALGLQDGRNPALPQLTNAPKGKGIEDLTWKLISGKGREGRKDRSTAIKHPTLRYLHRFLMHTLFYKKEVSNIAGEELRFLHQAVQHYASHPQLPIVPDDFYSDFGMVGYFVTRLMYYKDWAWTNRDSEPQIGIGGWITPLLGYLGIYLGTDKSGPAYLNGKYLQKVQFLAGTLDGRCVYSYKRLNKKAEIVLPNYPLTTLTSPGAIRFDIDEEHLLKCHGALGPVTQTPTTGGSDEVFLQGYTSKANEHLFGPPRYKFDQFTGALPLGPLRDAHDQISTLQRWSRAQDRTIYKLTNKCKELRRTVKRQAKASAIFMRKVTDVLTRGAVAGCKAEDFDIDALITPPPQPLYDPSAPESREQSLRSLRNPYIFPSESGNKSPSLDTTDEDDNSEASASSHAP
ncbi:Uncharacterized protein Rs2_35777 [Raphanus sativus]|nr:Uncharacterized protein Rs2_35777 [Raphanus sativus]